MFTKFNQSQIRRGGGTSVSFSLTGAVNEVNPLNEWRSR